MLDNPTLIDLAPLTIPLFRRNHRARRRLNVRLSPRERMIMQNVANGMTLVGIAQKYHISVGVVRLYVACVHRKLGVQSTPCAVAKCVELKLIRADVGECVEVER